MSVEPRPPHGAAPYPTQPADRPRPDPRLARSSRLLLPILAVSLIWRLPSLVDPPWVNDEGTYFAVAQAMAHGYRLYADVWENKPPAIYLLYSAILRLAGPSLLAVRLVTALAVAFLIVLLFLLGREWTGEGQAAAATLLGGLLLGVPFLEGTTANAEVFLALFTTLAIYLALARTRPALAGICMAAAILFKAVAGFDAVALGLWLLIHHRRWLGPYAATLGLVLAAACGLAAVAGIFSAMLRDAVLYDLGYVGHANGGSLPWLLLLKLGALLAVTAALRRAPFPYLWLAYAAAGSLSSGRFFGHYALQALPPLALCIALLLPNRPTLSSRLLVALPVSFVALAGLSAAAGWSLAASGHDSILARRLQYYANVVRLAVGAESYATYRDQVDDHVTRNERVAESLTRLPPGKLLIWGNVPWVYVLSGRLPATPYTSALRSPPVPGETASLRRALGKHDPQIVVVIRPPAPALGPAARALAGFYVPVRQFENAAVYRSVAGRPG